MAVVRTFAGRLRQLAGLVEDLSFRHVTGRVAKAILAQCEADQRCDDQRPSAHLTQQQMAAIVGTAREVVGRVIDVLTLRGDRIAAVTAFIDEDLFSHFGLPPTLPAE